MTPTCARMPQERRHRRRQQERRRLGRDPPEQRRAEQDAGQDLADHRRLPQPREQRAQRARRDDHHRQRQQHVHEHVDVFLGSAVAEHHRARPRSGGDEVAPQVPHDQEAAHREADQRAIKAQARHPPEGGGLLLLVHGTRNMQPPAAITLSISAGQAW